MFVDEKRRSLTEEQKNEMFHSLYKEMLQKAKKQHPKVDVKERVNEVYRKSQVIRGLPTSVSDPKLGQEIDDTIHQLMGRFNDT
jgi:nicotinamide riboside kinase